MADQEKSSTPTLTAPQESLAAFMAPSGDGSAEDYYDAVKAAMDELADKSQARDDAYLRANPIPDSRLLDQRDFHAALLEESGRIAKRPGGPFNSPPPKVVRPGSPSGHYEEEGEDEDGRVKLRWVTNKTPTAPVKRAYLETQLVSEDDHSDGFVTALEILNGEKRKRAAPKTWAGPGIRPTGKNDRQRQSRRVCPCCAPSLTSTKGKVAMAVNGLPAMCASCFLHARQTFWFGGPGKISMSPKNNALMELERAVIFKEIQEQDTWYWNNEMPEHLFPAQPSEVIELD